MRVLHAYVSQEFFDSWAAKETAAGRKPTTDAFLRTFGTPLITYEHTDKPSFVAVERSSCIRINYNYFNEQKDFMKAEAAPPNAEADTDINDPTELIVDAVHATLTPLRSTLDRIRDRIRSWFSNEA